MRRKAKDAAVVDIVWVVDKKSEREDSRNRVSSPLHANFKLKRKRTSIGLLQGHGDDEDVLPIY